jgi:hypothetical protein
VRLCLVDEDFGAQAMCLVYFWLLVGVGVL